jgi:ActR/RegA family two-component response regulator
MPQPRLLLIDDEPALADFLASAAQESGFDPVIAAHDEEFRQAFVALESAFRLGEALGLTMVGPVEKPVRFDVLEQMLSRLKATL